MAIAPVLGWWRMQSPSRVRSANESPIRPATAISRKLGVAPEECLYVGDGSSSELSGATSAGMTAALLETPFGTDFRYDAESRWTGRSVSDLHQVTRPARLETQRRVTRPAVWARWRSPRCRDQGAPRRIGPAAHVLVGFQGISHERGAPGRSALLLGSPGRSHPSQRGLQATGGVQCRKLRGKAGA